MNCRLSLLCVAIAGIGLGHNGDLFAEGDFKEQYNPSANITADELFEKVLDTRRQITSAKIVLREITEVGHWEPEEDTQRSEQTFEFEFDPSGRRLDFWVKWTRLDGTEGSKQAPLSELVLKTDGSHVFAGDMRKVSIFVGTSKPRTAAIHDLDIDPRLSGLSSRSLHVLRQIEFTDIYSPFHNGTPRVESTVNEDGEELFRIVSEYELPRSTPEPIRLTLTIDPQRNFSVVSGEVFTEEYQQTFHNTNQLWPNGIWFPKETLIEGVASGETVSKKRILTDVFEVPYEVDPQRFELATFHVKPGRHANVDGKSMLWDGTQLIDDPRYAVKPATPLASIVPERRKWLLIGNAALFTIIALGTLIVWSRSRRTRHRTHSDATAQ